MTENKDAHPLEFRDGQFYWRGYFKSPRDLLLLAIEFERSDTQAVRQYAKDIRAALAENAVSD